MLLFYFALYMSKGNNEQNPFKINKDTLTGKQDSAKTLFSDLFSKDHYQPQLIFTCSNNPALSPNPFKQDVKPQMQPKLLMTTLFYNRPSIFDNNESSNLFCKQIQKPSQSSITIYPMAGSIFLSKLDQQKQAAQNQHNHVQFRCAGCNKDFIRKDIFNNNISSDKEAQKGQLDTLQQLERQIKNKDRKIIRLQGELESFRKKKTLAEFTSRKWQDIAQWEDDFMLLVQSVQSKSSNIGQQLQTLILKQERQMLQGIKKHLNATSDLLIEHLTAFSKTKQVQSECTRKLYTEIKKDLEGRIAQYKESDKIKVGSSLSSGVIQHFVKELVTADDVLQSLASLKKQAEKLKTHLKQIA